MCILLYNLSKCILIRIHEFICSFMQWMSFEKILCPSTGHVLMNKWDLRDGLFLSPLPHLTLQVKLALRLSFPVDHMASFFPFLLGVLCSARAPGKVAGPKKQEVSKAIDRCGVWWGTVLVHWLLVVHSLVGGEFNSWGLHCTPTGCWTLVAL